MVLFAQLCPTLCDPMDCSPPGFSVHESPQASILECVAIPFSGGSSWRRDQTQVSSMAGRFFTIWASREAPIHVRRGLSSGIGAHGCGGGQVPSLPGGLQTREEPMVQLRSEGRLLAELPLPPRTLFCFLLKPSPDWRRPTHTVRIIYSMDLNVNLILKIPSGQQPHVWPHIWVAWLSHIDADHETSLLVKTTLDVLGRIPEKWGIRRAEFLDGWDATQK